MTAQEIVEMLNKGNVKRQDIAELMEVSANTITRIIAAGGFKYDNSAKKYVLGEAQPTTKETKEKVNKESKKEEIQQATKVIRKNATFELNKELIKQYKIKAVQEERNLYELIEEALQEYIK